MSQLDSTVAAELDVAAPASPAAPAHPFALESNLALMAGAGAGKTYSLMTLCLHLLSGARAGKTPLRPGQLHLVTFTDKAAAELRVRLSARLEKLAVSKLGPDDERELRASLYRLGQPLPPPAFWRQLRDDIGAASIGTFHGLCGKMLRRAPPGLGIDPGFELLDERGARMLLEDVTERLVLEALESKDPELEKLCLAMGFRGSLRRPGLIEALAQASGKIREEGLHPSRVGISDEATARADFDRMMTRVRSALGTAFAAPESDAFSEQLSHYRRVVEGLTPENLFESGRQPFLERLLGEDRRWTSKRKNEDLQHALKTLKWAVSRPSKADEDFPFLPDLAAGVRACADERTMKRLLVELERRYLEALRQRQALDFTGLLGVTRDLLRDNLEVRREVQGRMGALLVDEFQDTNRLQLELVTLWAEERSGGPRPTGPDDVVGLPLEPGFLCAVGDRKQSIYEFRGADVSVFNELADKMEGAGGQRAFLQTNYRSTPELLAFFNASFAELMGESSGAATDVPYRPAEDDLAAKREQKVRLPSVERLVAAAPGESASDCRTQEAERVAERIRQLLTGPQALKVVDPKDGALRPARGGDVALLFKRFSYLEVYRQALFRAGVPHQVLRGRGFFGAQEIQDLASYLSLMADPDDALALVALLRSPYVGWSDPTLFQVTASMPRVSLPAVRAATAAHVTGVEKQAFESFDALFSKLRSERDRLGLREVLRLAVSESGVRTALSGMPYGEQALANLEKLEELAARWDAAGTGDVAAFASELRLLADDERAEAQADVVDGHDPRAVQLLTVHAAKGLEWPIVFVVDLAAQPANQTPFVQFDRTAGLSMRTVLEDATGSRTGPRYAALLKRANLRADAEQLRLFYVAVTRARDYLVLSGHPPEKGRSGKTWAAQLDAAFASNPALAKQVATFDPLVSKSVRLVQNELPLLEPPVAPETLERLEAAVARARTPRARPWKSATFPVTQLANFALCPRRYRYAHELGLTENPVVLELSPLEPEEREEGAGGAPSDVRARGTLAHRLLELFDFRWLLEGTDAVERKLEELWTREAGLTVPDAAKGDVLAGVRAFLQSDDAQRLSQLPPERLHRELPFLLRLEDPASGRALHLKGQIDLLVEEAGPGGASVIDYKFSRRHAKGLGPYGFQLDAYALAAAHMLAPGTPVRTGLAFLRERSAAPDYRDSAGFSREATEARLLQAGIQLLEYGPNTAWPGQPLSRCLQLECGYRYRCHPDERA